ncbi:MAG: hypothetical protein K8L99_05015, partial [Anaerolineae bacterium]|nr:hypothetical protein [Anaerolineae bacterium]
MFKKCLILIGMLTALVQVSPALACSGGVPLTLPELVEEAEVIVQGHFEILDDAGQNGVMQVQSYLKGGPGPTHILLSLYTPPGIESTQERFSGGGCFYGVSPALQASEEIVIFLQRKADGSFELAPRHFTNPMYYPFATDDSPIRVFLNAEGRVFTYDEAHYAITSDSIPLTLDEFANHITEANGEEVQPPLENSPYPLFAPLLLTTTTGSRYRLPVDGSDPLLLTDDDLHALRRHDPACATIGCTGFSPNGMDFAQIQLRDDQPTLVLMYGSPIPGEAFVFSSTSDALAVWVTQHDSAQIQVYTLRYSRLRVQDEDALLWRVVDVQLQGAEYTTGHAAWSPDGRWLAYSDVRGVWLWDVFTPDSEPQLLLDEPLWVKDWSATGRYLTVEGDSGSRIIDLVTLDRLPGGVLSPDDRVLLTYEPEFRVIWLTPRDWSGNFLPVGSHVRKAIWKNNRQYLALTCPDESDRDSCRVGEGAIVGVSGGIYTGYDFDYAAAGDGLAIIQDDTTLLLRIRP